MSEKKQDGHMVSFWISKEDFEKLREAASAEERTVSGQIRYLLREFMGQKA